ncbi:hypothetical protein CC80DRAFT_449939 [Byssothecium circinans]|uniref:non-specific serine/threonine protein kinase n=1 Tax=Byssothecium circinans TaxID=147558 RepID=A0A6A5TTE5_9PLEO|nr:hypothetical protein CC80DRAFT_449939 [Byssothecium circinans]
MAKRRPPGGGVKGVKGIILHSLALTSLPWVAAGAQQQHPQEQNAYGHDRSPREAGRVHTLTPQEQHQQHGKPGNARLVNAPVQSLPTLSVQNERAVAIKASSAPAISAVRSPSPNDAASSEGSLQPSARSIQDLDVEDFVLLATVDGHVHARDRYNGEKIWELNYPEPMLETINNDDNQYDDLSATWIVEPIEDGALYILLPGVQPQLRSLGTTVKQLVELSPYSSDEPAVVYTAEKKSKMLTVDATNGSVTQTFSPAGGSSLSMSDRCTTHSGDPFHARERECKGIFNLGQNEYTISIHNRETGELMSTIKYREWTTNNRDRDLQAQYHTPKDQQYIFTGFNGDIKGYDLKRSKWALRPVFEKALSYPVYRVFDVVRTRDDDNPTPALMILPQPPAPARVDHKAKHVWLNTTNTGSWFALSETHYPNVTDSAPTALCYRGHTDGAAWGRPHALPERKRLVGVHVVGHTTEPPATYRAISAPTSSNPVVEYADTLPQHPASTSIEFHSIDPPPITIEPVTSYMWVWLFTILCVVGVGAVSYTKGIGGPSPSSLLHKAKSKFIQSRQLEASLPASTEAPKQETLEPLVIEQTSAEQIVKKSLEPPVTEESEAKEVLTEGAQPSAEPPVSRKQVTFALPTEDEDLSLSRTATAEDSSPTELTESIETLPITDEASPPVDQTSEFVPHDPTPAPATPAKKKKAHRGKRGGAKGKNKKTKEGDEMDQIVDAAKQLVPSATLHPDEITNAGDDMQDISNTKKIGKLTIDFDRVLGNGSGGTFVFEGKWNDRDVAVKRMLPQYFGLAEQEVKLLRESDQHSNVIRYFDDEKDENFLYIAVELCQASLFDLYRDGRVCDEMTENQQRLVTEINSNVARALHQLAEGVNHLHSLRIIHRDIKPQNILIAYPKRNQTNGPRLVISDFGLCKTLPDNMSTLIGTTANAGTVGWKAPELILQPRDIGVGSSTGHSRESSASTDPVSQGVKRAVDIFSLGCVFFYVLTNGSHPFDDEEGWAQMREYNIKKNKASFRQLDMGDDSEEPIHLISWMLSNRPEDRPTAAQVMNHPFFWNAEKRLAFLCDCSDHWEREPRDPPSEHLQILEDYSTHILTDEHNKKRDFLAKLDYSFVQSLGKQRKYTPDRILDLLRALRNKKNHYEDMDANVKARVGPLPHGYLRYWTLKFPRLVMSCYDCVVECGLQEEPRFKPYFEGVNQ